MNCWLQHVWGPVRPSDNPCNFWNHLEPSGTAKPIFCVEEFASGVHVHSLRLSHLRETGDRFQAVESCCMFLGLLILGNIPSIHLGPLRVSRSIPPHAGLVLHPQTHPLLPGSATNPAKLHQSVSGFFVKRCPKIQWYYDHCPY